MISIRNNAERLERQRGQIPEERVVVHASRVRAVSRPVGECDVPKSQKVRDEERGDEQNGKSRKNTKITDICDLEGRRSSEEGSIFAALKEV